MIRPKSKMTPSMPPPVMMAVIEHPKKSGGSREAGGSAPPPTGKHAPPPVPDDEVSEEVKRAAENPIGEIAERYGLSEEEGKAFIRECLDFMLGEKKSEEEALPGEETPA